MRKCTELVWQIVWQHIAAEQCQAARTRPCHLDARRPTALDDPVASSKSGDRVFVSAEKIGRRRPKAPPRGATLDVFRLGARSDYEGFNRAMPSALEGTSFALPEFDRLAGRTVLSPFKREPPRTGLSGEER